MPGIATRIARVVLVLVGGILAAAIGYVLFVDVPSGDIARLLGVLLVVAVALVGARVGQRYAGELFAPYNVARVSVEGPIARRPGKSIPTGPVITTADDVVEEIERADGDDAVRALEVVLDTPGGEVVPSDDIRIAVEQFDGPTVAYARDTCASGGYWIASGCDHIVAREGSIVGSIGVVASRITGEGLLDRLGLTYERLVAGEYKDAGIALRDMDPSEREYLQGIVDDYYSTFVDRVTDGRDLDPESIEETEARVFLGEDALDRGLVDEIGTLDAVDAWVADEIEAAVEAREFEPDLGLASRLRTGAQRVAFAFGAGLSSVLVGDSASSFEFR